MHIKSPLTIDRGSGLRPIHLQDLKQHFGRQSVIIIRPRKSQGMPKLSRRRIRTLPFLFLKSKPTQSYQFSLIFLVLAVSPLATRRDSPTKSTSVDHIHLDDDISQRIACFGGSISSQDCWTRNKASKSHASRRRQGSYR